MTNIQRPPILNPQLPKIKKVVCMHISIEELRKAQRLAKKNKEAVISEFVCNSSDNIRNYLLGIPKRYQWNWLQSKIGKNGSSKAIKAKCYDCSAYDVAEVYNCTVETCPLWHLRPKQKPSKLTK